MNRKLPPNLYARTYKTRGGYKRTLYYPRFKDWKGKRRTFPGVADFDEAKVELSRLKTLNTRHHDFDADSIPAATLFPWIARFLKLKAGKKTVDRDELSADWLREFFKDCPLETITTTWMLEYRSRRSTAAPATINRELAFLRSVLTVAHHDGALLKLPVFPMEAEHNDRVRTASEKEYRAILRHLPTHIREPIEILWETGFRLGEVLKITPVALNNRAVDVSKIREKGGLKRSLPMSARAWQILSSAAKGKAKDEPLFRISRYQVRWHFLAACQTVGTIGLWVHDLRASFATRKEREGWPRKVICEYTGHRTEYAFRRYSRPTVDDLKAFIGQRSGNKDNLRLIKGRLN